MIKITRDPFVKRDYFFNLEFSTADEVSELIEWLDENAEGWSATAGVLHMPDYEKDLIFQLRWL